MTQKTSRESRVPATQDAAIYTLTGTLTGTALHALTDITYNGTWSQAQANEINLNIKVLQTKMNLVFATLRNQGLIDPATAA